MRPDPRRGTAATLCAAVVLLALLGHGVLVSVGAAAQDTVDLSATPTAGSSPAATPRFGIAPVGDHPEGYFDDLPVEPGGTVELAVELVNEGDRPVGLRTYKVNALAGANGGFRAGAPDDPPAGATAWVDYPTREVEVGAGARHPVPFTVTVPPDAPPGQYMAGLVVTMADPDPIPGSTVLTQEISYAISLGILVPGELEHAFTLGDPAVQRPLLTVPLTNTGTYLVRPEGTLTLRDASGAEVHASSIAMGSVYQGVETIVAVLLPDQLAAGTYRLTLALTDPASGASAELVDVPVTLPEPVAPSAVAVEAAVQPNADPIAYADVAVTLTNSGAQLPAVDVTLTVYRDGEEIEAFPLATSRVLPGGETALTARYLPAEGWAPGVYTFTVTVSAVAPAGGDTTVLATAAVPSQVAVP